MPLISEMIQDRNKFPIYQLLITAHNAFKNLVMTP